MMPGSTSSSEPPRRSNFTALLRAVLVAAIAFGLSARLVANSDTGYVVLVHGLWRSSRSMEPMAEALEKEGFKVLNLEYESRQASIEELSEAAIGPALEELRKVGAKKVNFVTHSMGGILVRSYFSRHPADIVGRVVMLGPPNQGSEAIDAFDELPLFDEIMGPAARELSTKAGSLPNKLGRPAFQFGVIAGDRSLNPVESAVIPGPDDSKVSVERTKLEGMTDHIVVEASHPFIMRNPTAIRQTIHFLKSGKFEHPGKKVMRPVRSRWMKNRTGR